MSDEQTTKASCEWELVDPEYGTWESSCDNAFTICEGSPKQNDMRFCCHCGLSLKEVNHVG